MTRDEATKQALSLGLSGQALQQKVEELMGNTASNFSGGSWKYGNEGAAEKKIADLEQEKRMNAPIEGATGNIARGNQGDNAIANQNALDTSEVTQSHKEELANAQNQLGDANPSSYTTNPDGTVTEGVEGEIKERAQELASGEEKPKTEEEVVAKKGYDKAMMSIWDAYREGLISKDTAGYFTIDALATMAKNLGRSIGNVGAQFSGGSIDQGHNTSAWENRKNELLGEATTMEKETMGGPASRVATSENLSNQAKAISNSYNAQTLQSEVELKLNQLKNSNSARAFIDDLEKKPADQRSKIDNFLIAYMAKSGEGAGASMGANSVSNVLNWILTLAK